MKIAGLRKVQSSEHLNILFPNAVWLVSPI
jgi:hypothetical protein